MTTIKPTPEQFAEWLAQAMHKFATRVSGPTEGLVAGEVARLAYAAGADAELEACMEWLPSDFTIDGQSLRDDRRPKPPSLKQQALRDLDAMVDYIRITQGFEPAYPTTIKEALEALPDDTCAREE